MNFHQLNRALVGLTLGLAVLLAPAVGSADPLTVFAAASLKNALDEVATAWKSGGGGEVAASYASSSTLAKQIEQGAPADIFISADKQWINYVQQRKLIGAPKDLLGNKLVLVAPANSIATIDIRPGFDLAGLLGDGRLALGDPSNVPAGIYAKEALEKLGAWKAVEAKLAPAADVRAALALVSRGEAPFGIVYATDAKVEAKVRVAGTFPENSHAPIVYPVAILVSSKNADAAKFVTFLKSSAAKAIFEHYGFLPL